MKKQTSAERAWHLPYGPYDGTAAPDTRAQSKGKRKGGEKKKRKIWETTV